MIGSVDTLRPVTSREEAEARTAALLAVNEAQYAAERQRQQDEAMRAVALELFGLEDSLDNGQ